MLTLNKPGYNRLTHGMKVIAGILKSTLVIGVTAESYLEQ